MRHVPLRLAFRVLPLFAGLVAIPFVRGQSNAPSAGATPAETPAWTAQQDHRNMLEQLGITALRPGANGRAQAGEPNAANYDEAKANPFPDWPDPLTLQNGRKITSPEEWWSLRRPEIMAAFEREVYGRVPATVPSVTWSVAQETA